MKHCPLQTTEHTPPHISNPQLMFLLILTIFIILQPGMGHTKMRSNNKIMAGTPPYEIVKKILKANNLSVQRYSAKKQGFTPLITWLTDPDVRIQPDMIIEKPANNLFTCRNFGSQLENSMGEVDYGILHLHTPILLITSSSDNQAIKFFMKDYRDLELSIRKDLDHLHLPMVKDIKKEEFAERLAKNIEANIDYQVERAIIRYKERIRMGRLTVIGSVADFNNTYKRGKGRLIIININGEKDDKKLRSMTMIKSVSPQLRSSSIGRKRPKSKKINKGVGEL